MLEPHKGTNCSTMCKMFLLMYLKHNYKILQCNCCTMNQVYSQMCLHSMVQYKVYSLDVSTSPWDESGIFTMCLYPHGHKSGILTNVSTPHGAISGIITNVSKSPWGESGIFTNVSKSPWA